MEKKRDGFGWILGLLIVGGIVAYLKWPQPHPAPTPAPFDSRKDKDRSRPFPKPQPVDLWQVQHKGRTIRQWYDLARNKYAIKLEREDAIAELGTAGQAGGMALRELLKASDQDTVVPYSGQWSAYAVQAGFVRWHAVTVLGRIGTTAQAAAPRLAEMMRKDPVVEVRSLAAQALGGIRSRDPAVLQALKEVLKSPDYPVWQPAIFAMGQLWPVDPEALQLLEKVANLPINSTAPLAILNSRVQARTVLLEHQRGDLVR